jgi:tetratricopeptide (TPR) repeat protein
VDEDSERKTIYQKMARLLESKLDQADDAIEAYRQVMYLDERDLSTLDALERLYIVRMRWNDLIDVLNQQGAAMSDPAERIEKFLQIGELWETRLQSPDRAIDAFREALGIDENCVEAMDCLERLYQQQERWIELLDTYELKLGILSDAAAQVGVYRRIASVQENNLNDVYSAVDTFRKLMSLDAGDRESMSALQRLYTDAERWDELAETYELHLGGVEDADTVLAIRTALGDLFSGPLNDANRAIECLAPILESVTDHVPTLRKLGDLYRANEDWRNCIDMLSREVHQISDHGELLQKQFQVGRIYLDNVGDLEQAERWFKGALDHDKNYMPALRALLDVNLKRGEWSEAVRALQMMEAASRQFAEKSQCLFEIGQIYDKHIGDRTVAIDYYEQAMDMSPENASAAEPLLNVYWDEKNWARAAPLFDLILKDRAGMDIREQQERLFRAGVCAEHLEQVDKAVGYYRQAYELDSTHLPTLKGMGGLLFRQEEWDRAFKIYQTVLVHHREHLEPQEIVDIFVRQGRIKLNVGERRKALDFFRKALDMDPQNTGTMEALITMHMERGDWEDVVHYQRQMVPLLSEANERFALLIRIADTLNEKLNQPRQAVEAYNQALAEEPGSRMILGKLLGLHEDAGNWKEAVAVLMQLAEGEQEATRKAKYWCGVATLQQKYLDERFEAVRSFDKALDADPSMLRAFEAIDHMLTEERNYERQDRYYRKMLKRATDFGLDDNLVFSLAKNLGEINRTRLKRYAEAIKAYKIALTRRPSDVATHQIVAQLYELDGNTDQAIAQHYNLIKSEPRAIESYKHLYRLFMESARYDAAWCVAQVLVLFKQADDEQKAFFDKYRSRTLNRAQRPLEPRHWGALSHPDMSILLRNMLTEVWRYIVGAWASTHKDLRINKRKHLINPDEQTAFNGTLAYACQVTRFARPSCYRDPANRQGLRAANMQEPTLLVGDDVVRGARIQEQAFAAGKHLYLTQPSFFLATLDEGYDQRKNRILATIYSIMKLVKPDSKVQPEESLLELFQKTIPQNDRVSLGKQIGEMGSDPNLHLNVSKWLQAVDHTANRVGLLLSDDLVAATDVIKNETGTFSRASAQDRIRALVLFALSEEYFALRKALGLSIDSGQ